VKRTFNLRN